MEMGIPDEVLITNPELVIELAEKDLDNKYQFLFLIL